MYKGSGTFKKGSDPFKMKYVKNLQNSKIKSENYMKNNKSMI